MPAITIVTVNWYCIELIEQLLRNLIDRAHRSAGLKALVIDNTNGTDESIHRLKACGIECNIHSLNPKGLKGSRAHAFGLNYAMGLLDTEYVLIVDPDIHVFKEGWDEFCINSIQKNDCLAIGAPYPNWKVGRYHDFPSPPFCFFDSKILREIHFDWTPFGRNRLENILVFAVRQIGRLGTFTNRKTFEQYRWVRSFSKRAERTFGVFSQDTGWRIAGQAKAKRLKSILFEAVTASDTHLAPEGAVEIFRTIASEYELYCYDGTPILTHKYGTGGRPWRTTRGGDKIYWRQCIEAFEKHCQR